MSTHGDLVQNLSSDHLRILAVDDEQSMLDAYQRVLAPFRQPSGSQSEMEELAARLFGAQPIAESQLNFDLVLCKQGDEAVELIRAATNAGQPFSVVFLDMRLPPGPDGVATAERIRAIDPQVEILFVTAYSDHDPYEIARKVPPPDKLLYLQKPFHPEEIKQFASALGAKWQLERLLKESNARLEERVKERTAQLTETNRRLQESEERYRDLIENAHDMIQSVAPDGEILLVNQAWLKTLGYREEDLPALNLFQVIHPDSIRQWKEIFSRAADGQPTKNFQTSFLTKKGRAVLVEGNVSGRYVDGTLFSIQGIFRDVTEREELQRQLRHAHKMEAVGTLAGGMAHEFNNILAVIQGYIQLISLRLEGDHPLSGYIKEIDKASHRAAGLTRRMLDFARLDGGRKCQLKVSQLIQGTKELLKQTLPPNIKIEVDLDEKIPPVMAEPHQLEQVLMNLAVNARDAMPKGGTLRFGTGVVTLDRSFCRSHPWAKPGRYVELSVQDTGEGIAPDVLEHIFEPFFTTKEPGKGTGLGLSIVYSIIKNHGGYIWAESQRGEGTCLRIYLPVITETKSIP
jgi:two-component system cell cycle sensor histidine kinase/response regulator CckA